jgi:WD40 repeat protein
MRRITRQHAEILCVASLLFFYALAGCSFDNQTDGVAPSRDGTRGSEEEISAVGDLDHLKPGSTDWFKELNPNLKSDIPGVPDVDGLIALLPGEGAGQVAWAADSRTFATVGEFWSRFPTDPARPRLTLWDLGGRKPIIRDQFDLADKPFGATQVVAVAPDGKTLATGHSNETVFLWHVEDGKLRKGAALEGYQGPVSGLGFSSDGNKLAVTSGGEDLILSSARTGVIWDLPGPKPAIRGKKFDLGTQPGLRAVTFTRDGATLLLNRRERWDLTTEPPTALDLYPVSTPGGLNRPTIPVDGAPKGKWGCWADDLSAVAYAGPDRSVVVWERDGTAWKERATLRGHKGEEGRPVAFAADGRGLLTASTGDAMIVWDGEGNQVRRWELVSFGGLVEPIDFTPDGRNVVARYTHSDRPHLTRFYAVLRIKD